MIKRTQRNRLAAGVVLATFATATVAATTTLAGNAAGAGTAARAGDQQAAAAKGWKPAWHSEFGSPRSQWPTAWRKVEDAPLSAWSTKDRVVVSPGKSQARNLAKNVDLANGKLVITTRRLCAKVAPTSETDFSWLADSKPSVKACSGARKVPVYTSGRLQMEAAAYQASGAAVRMDFRATLPSDPATGTRQALWANNAQPYCSYDGKTVTVTNLGEVDAVEWYGNKPGASYSTTHMSCATNGAHPGRTLRREHQDPVKAGSTHTWTVIKRGNTATYLLDGKAVEEKEAKAIDSCRKAPFTVPDTASCATIMRSPWMTILQGEVFAGKYKAANRQSGPNDKAAFPVQKLKVDWVRVYTG